MNYTLIHGDMMEEVEELDDGSVDLVVTDPPYNISDIGRDMGFHDRKDVTQDFGEWDKDEILPVDWVPPLVDELAEGARLVAFYDNRSIDHLLGALRENGLQIVQKGYWRKSSPAPRFVNQERWMGAVEEFVVAAKGAEWTFRSDKRQRVNIINARSPRGSDRVHPTQKPLKVMQEIVDYWSKPGETVLDPFMGSGTTGIASSNRDFIGIELDEDYYEIASDRITGGATSVFG